MYCSSSCHRGAPGQGLDAPGSPPLHPAFSHGAALGRSLSLSDSAKPDAGREDAKVLRLKEGSMTVPVTVIRMGSQGRIQEGEQRDEGEKKEIRREREKLIA